MRKQKHPLKKLRDMPANKRPSMIPTFPRGKIYFQQWRYVRWFVVMLLPIVASCVACGVRKKSIFLVSLIAIIGGGFTLALFVDICDGMASSNHGTFFKDKEPIRYWLSVAVVSVVYLMLSVAGYSV